MKRHITSHLVAAICSVVLLGGVAASPVQAQLFGRGPYHEPIFDRVQSDLSRAMEHAYKRNKLSHAQRELVEFQAERASGRFGGRQYHRAVNALTDVVRSNGIDSRDRDNLARDLDAMREFGARNGY